MRARATLIAAAVLVTALGGSSLGATKKVCNLLLDEAGDAEIIQNDDATDIIGGDIATDGTKVTGVIRIAKWAALDTQAPQGRAYYLLFSVPGAEFPLYMNFGISLSGQAFTYGNRQVLATGNGSYVKAGDATGVIDEAKNEIRITVPVKDFAAVGNVKPGVKVSGINAATSVYIPSRETGGVVLSVDTAETAKAYMTGTPSCVAVGK